MFPRICLPFPSVLLFSMIVQLNFGSHFVSIIRPLSFLNSSNGPDRYEDGHHPFGDLMAHFANIDNTKIVRLENKLAKVKEFVHRMAYGNRTFSVDNEADRAKPVSISPAQPNVSAAMVPILFEGDIFLNERQLNTLFDQLKGRRKSHAKRSLISADPEALWTQLPIKFRLHDSLETTTIQQIVEAIAFWENNTCLTFEQLGQEPIENGVDFVEFFKGLGCYSMIGRYGGRQGVSIGAGCEKMGIVEHEIGHVLGLWHEQSRPDAWEYVQVDKEFVLPSYSADFQLHSNEKILTLELPYDYGSVMHYGPTAFSSDGISQTLITKNALFQSTIGQRDRLAFYDVMAINKAYCADKCGGIPQLRSSQLPSSRPTSSVSSIECLNGGYANPKRCSECICPSGYGGRRCERAQRSENADCGGKLSVMMDEWEEVNSPDYDGDGYKQGQQCNWIVHSPSGTRILAEFIDHFAMFCATVCMDYVELKLSKDQRLTGARFCCDNTFTEQLISEHNQMAILFRAQLSQDIGFRLRLRATELPASKMLGNSSSDHPRAASMESPRGEEWEDFSDKTIWGEWGPWSECSRPCGACGIRSRRRNCLMGAECSNGNEKGEEFGVCNLRACPAQSNCQRTMILNHLCRSSSKSDVCSQIAEKIAECNNKPSCCPPFNVNNGICVRQLPEEGSASR